MAHEIGHALGAMDTYDPVTSRATHPHGFVEPFANPLYPQRFAELMAVDIPLNAKIEKEVKSLSQLRVGHQSAAGMGWIDPEQAQIFYAPTEITPEEKLEITPKQPTDPGEAPTRPSTAPKAIPTQP